MRSYFFILIFFILASCQQEATIDSPAKKQIEEYNKQQAACDNNEIINKTNDEPKNIDGENIEDLYIENSKESKENTAPNNKPEESTQLQNSINSTEEVKTYFVRNSPFDYDQYDIILGDPNSPVRVIQYSSPTCVHCAYYNKAVFIHIKEKYIDTKKIAYVIRELITNKQDKDAAVLAHCAGKERFVQFMNILYSTQSSWVYATDYLQNLINIGKIGGVSEEQYSKCLADPKLLDGILSLSMEAGKSLKVAASPVFFINGQLHKQSYSEKALSDAIDLELQKTKTNEPK